MGLLRSSEKVVVGELYDYEVSVEVGAKDLLAQIDSLSPYIDDEDTFRLKIRGAVSIELNLPGGTKLVLYGVEPNGRVAAPLQIEASTSTKVPLWPLRWRRWWQSLSTVLSFALGFGIVTFPFVRSMTFPLALAVIVLGASVIVCVHRG